MINPEKYESLPVGKAYQITSFGVKRNASGVLVTTKTVEIGVLIRATSKRKEIIVEGERTGKYETRGDVCVFDPEVPGIDWVTIGCGMFGIEEIE